MNFKKSDISGQYHPFQFPILNELLNNREHKIISNIDDYSMAVIMLAVHVMLADNLVQVGETKALRAKLAKMFPAISIADITYLVKMYLFQFKRGRDAHIFNYSYNFIPEYINREIRDKTVKNNLCYFLCEIALADNKFSKSEKLLLLKICRSLGLTDMDIARLFAYFEGRITDIDFSPKHRWEKQEKTNKQSAKTKSKRTSQRPSKSTFNYRLYKYHSALIILGVTKNTSVDLIKRAYKKLAMTYHPDRFVNVPAMEKQKSTEMFIKIQDAYELVKKIKRFT